jgi:peptide/nickel transport system permease protein
MGRPASRTVLESKTMAEQLLFTAQQSLWQQYTRRLRCNTLLAFATLFLVSIYTCIACAGFIAPYGENTSTRSLAYLPPSEVYFWKDNRLTWPFVIQFKKFYDAAHYSFGYEPLLEKEYPLAFWVKGEPYTLLGFLKSDIHLFGVAAPCKIYLLGGDKNGRDYFSRLLYGGQVSLTIGFLGLFIAFPIGLFYGGISGYWGGRIDTMMMRFAEVLMCFPTFYLLMSLAALLPAGMPSGQRFALIVAILAAIGWAGLSRVIRGMVLTLRQQEYVEAARVMGAGNLWIITRHILPQTATYFIIAATLSVPGYILAESGLSFLGLGIQPPDASWGNLLSDAQDLSNMMVRPWLLLAPASLISFTILSFNLVGDTLRDLLTPKSHST